MMNRGMFVAAGVAVNTGAGVGVGVGVGTAVAVGSAGGVGLGVGPVLQADRKTTASSAASSRTGSAALTVRRMFLSLGGLSCLRAFFPRRGSEDGLSLAG